MLDRDADLRLVRTADKALHYVLAENLQEFRKTHQVIEEQPAWEGGQRGVLTAKRAREEGFCKPSPRTPPRSRSIYQIGGQSSVDDPTLGQAIRPDLDQDRRAARHGQGRLPVRRIEQARQEKVNLVFFQIDSPGGTRLGRRQHRRP